MPAPPCPSSAQHGAPCPPARTFQSSAQVYRVGGIEYARYHHAVTGVLVSSRAALLHGLAAGLPALLAGWWPHAPGVDLEPSAACRSPANCCVPQGPRNGLVCSIFQCVHLVLTDLAYT